MKLKVSFPIWIVYWNVLSLDYSSSQDSLDLCLHESFNATCPINHVIGVTSAMYGRMRGGGRCLSGDIRIGCSSDVTSYFKWRCSGKRSCQVSVRTLVELQPCEKDFVSYLAIAHTCIKIGEFIELAKCRTGNKVVIPSSNFEANVKENDGKNLASATNSVNEFRIIDEEAEKTMHQSYAVPNNDEFIILLAEYSSEYTRRYSAAETEKYSVRKKTIGVAKIVSESPIEFANSLVNISNIGNTNTRSFNSYSKRNRTKVSDKRWKETVVYNLNSVEEEGEDLFPNYGNSGNEYSINNKVSMNVKDTINVMCQIEISAKVGQRIKFTLAAIFQVFLYSQIPVARESLLSRDNTYLERRLSKVSKSNQPCNKTRYLTEANVPTLEICLSDRLTTELTNRTGSNRLLVNILGSSTSMLRTTTTRLLIYIEVAGCPPFLTPYNINVRVKGRFPLRTELGCVEPVGMTWNLTCLGNTWMGRMMDCIPLYNLTANITSIENRLVQTNNPRNSNRTGYIVTLLLGTVIGIMMGMMALFFVIICRRSKKKLCLPKQRVTLLNNGITDSDDDRLTMSSMTSKSNRSDSKNHYSYAAEITTPLRNNNNNNPLNVPEFLYELTTNKFRPFSDYSLPTNEISYEKSFHDNSLPGNKSSHNNLFTINKNSYEKSSHDNFFPTNKNSYDKSPYENKLPANKSSHDNSFPTNKRSYGKSSYDNNSFKANKSSFEPRDRSDEFASDFYGMKCSSVYDDFNEHNGYKYCENNKNRKIINNNINNNNNKISNYNNNNKNKKSNKNNNKNNNKIINNNNNNKIINNNNNNKNSSAFKISTEEAKTAEGDCLLDDYNSEGIIIEDRKIPETPKPILCRNCIRDEENSFDNRNVSDLPFRNGREYYNGYESSLLYEKDNFNGFDMPSDTTTSERMVRWYGYEKNAISSPTPKNNAFNNLFDSSNTTISNHYNLNNLFDNCYTTTTNTNKLSNLFDSSEPIPNKLFNTYYATKNFEKSTQRKNEDTNCSECILLKSAEKKKNESINNLTNDLLVRGNIYDQRIGRDTKSFEAESRDIFCELCRIDDCFATQLRGYVETKFDET